MATYSKGTPSFTDAGVGIPKASFTDEAKLGILGRQFFLNRCARVIQTMRVAAIHQTLKPRKSRD
jgi:hypothetical protein